MKSPELSDADGFTVLRETSLVSLPDSEGYLFASGWDTKSHDKEGLGMRTFSSSSLS